MKIDISDIIKVDGASLNVEFNEPISDLNSIIDEFEFNNPVGFKGNITNVSSILKLNGRLETEYKAKCFRCLKDIDCKIDLVVKENFVESGKNADYEAYTYEGNLVELDKVLIDNIFLSLPMKQVCSEDCKGLCPICGCNLNEEVCNCKQDEDINPKMEALKNYFNK